MPLFAITDSLSAGTESNFHTNETLFAGVETLFAKHLWHLATPFRQKESGEWKKPVVKSKN